MLKTFLMRYKEVLLVLFLLLTTGFLRFYHLGHSDYISDEPATFFYRGGKKDPTLTPTEYILTRRKGPMQLFIGYIPYLLIGDYRNELAQRIPFALFNTFSVVILYYLVKKLTKNSFVAFVSAFLFGVNGLIVAYGRIAQYQSLNMFFSFTALWFYSFLLDSKPKGTILVNSLLGTLMLSFSTLSHWDVIYVLPVVVFFFVKFFLRSDVKLLFKGKLVLANLLLGCLVVLPFLIPYLRNLQDIERNVDYAQGIIGFGGPFKNRDDLFHFKLYNPLLTLTLYGVLGFLGVLVSYKKPVFVIWFISLLLFFRFFVKYSGLHFYNLFPPLVVLVSFGFWWLVQIKVKPLKYVALVGLVLVLAFLYYQSYLLFVDAKTEYPMEREKIVFWKTREYTHEDEMRHKTGFPHKRYWQEINDYINEQNYINGESFGYYTNEYRPHSRFYMDADFRAADGFYAVGIKRPLSFAMDYKLPQIKNKHTVYKIENEFGETVVRIYRVDDK